MSTLNSSNGNQGGWTPSGIGRPLLIVLAIAGAIYLITRNGCDNSFAGLIGLRHLKVDTWAEWCEHLSDVDMFERYNAFSLSYEPDSIRADFVRNFHPLFLKEVAKTYLAGATPDDKVVKELVRLKMIGVWNEGTTLHFANEIGIDLEDRFLERWLYTIEEDLKKERSQQSELEYLVYSTISSMFKTLILHGPNRSVATIELAFRFGK
jgi:hypothetical protein